MKQHNTAPQDILLTRKELAARHGVCVETCNRRIRAGLIRHLKIGRTVRFRLSDILAFEASVEEMR
jgi:excisionase family DNA binding protein